MHRVVTLVACDRDAMVLGQLAPFAVGTPWWQDTAPIPGCYPELTVLRLLDGIPVGGATVGGHVRYLIEVCSGTRPPTSLSSCDVVGDHPVRMPRGPTGRPGGRPGLGVGAGRTERPSRPAPELEPLRHLVNAAGRGESVAEVRTGFL
jgi:hypothetical protein